MPNALSTGAEFGLLLLLATYVATWTVGDMRWLMTARGGAGDVGLAAFSMIDAADGNAAGRPVDGNDLVSGAGCHVSSASWCPTASASTSWRQQHAADALLVRPLGS